MEEKSLTNMTGLFIGLAILMIVLGVAAIAMPLAAGLGVSIVVGWLIGVGGFFHLVYAFSARGAGSFLWHTLIGIIYIVGGFYFILYPGTGLATLTFFIGAILIAEGVLQAIVFFQARALPGAGWFLFDGLITLLLGILIISPWPSSSWWAIGTLVGINLLMSGFTRLMYSMTARKIIKTAAV